jgi:zinc protease
MFKVFDEMHGKNVSDEELADAKMRVTGSMVMGLQTIGQQADKRVEGILNGYPIDYYDRYPQRIAGVSAEEVRRVMNKYVHNEAMTIVVVTPAKRVLEQLHGLGEVKVIPMPSSR